MKALRDIAIKAISSLLLVFILMKDHNVSVKVTETEIKHVEDPLFPHSLPDSVLESD